MAPVVPRLKRRVEFLRTARAGRKWVTPGLIVQARRRSDDEDGPKTDPASVRVGFTVSKKVGNAVIRNRVRRRLRAAVDLALPSLARDGYDYVVIGRAGSLLRSFDALTDDLKSALVGVHSNKAHSKRAGWSKRAGRVSQNRGKAR